MIEIVFRIDAEYCFVEAKGHALFDNKGKDLVCCAVSTLIQNWMLSTKALCGADVEYEQDGGRASGKVKRTKETELLFDSLRLGIEVLGKQYSGQIHIRMEERNGS